MPDPTGRVSHIAEMHRGVAWKEPCRVATTANVTISTALNAGDTIDGVTLADGDRVLVKDQSTGNQNGIYIAGTTPTRAYDMDQDGTTDVPAEEIAGSFVWVLAGTANAQTLWRTTNVAGGTLGSTTITWTQFTGAGGSTITTKDEGSTLSSSVTTLDFVGSGVVASGGGATTTVTIAGGGGASHSYIGYNTVGGTIEACVANRIIAKSVTLASAGTLTSIEVYLDMNGDFVAGSPIIGVWADNSSAIGTLAHVTGSLVADNLLISGTGSSFPPRWLSFPCGIYLAAGTYWIGFMFSDVGSSIRCYYDGSGTDRRFDSGGAWVEDGQRRTQTDTTRKYSIRGNLLA